MSRDSFSVTFHASWRHFHVYLLLAVLSAVYFLEIWMQGLIYRGTGDAWLSTTPALLFVRRFWSRLAIPQWNPYLLCGTNAAGDTASPFFDITALPLAFVPANGLPLAATIRLWILFLAGAIILYRAFLWELPSRWALFSATGVLFSLFNVWATLQQYLLVSMLYFYALMYLILSRRARNSWRQFCMLTMLLSLLMLASNLLLAFVLCLTVFALTAYLSWRDKDGLGPLAVLLVSGLAAVSISSVRLLPVLLALCRSNRFGSTSPSFFAAPSLVAALPRSYIPDFLGWRYSETFLQPSVFGNLETANLSYAGAVTFLLACLGLVIQRDRKSLVLWGIGFFFVFLALGAAWVFPLWYVLTFPFGSSFEYFAAGTPFILAWIGGMHGQKFEENAKPWGRAEIRGLTFLTAGLVLAPLAQAMLMLPRTIFIAFRTVFWGILSLASATFLMARRMRLAGKSVEAISWLMILLVGGWAAIAYRHEAVSWIHGVLENSFYRSAVLLASLGTVASTGTLCWLAGKRLGLGERKMAAVGAVYALLLAWMLLRAGDVARGPVGADGHFSLHGAKDFERISSLVLSLVRFAFIALSVGALMVARSKRFIGPMTAFALILLIHCFDLVGTAKLYGYNGVIPYAKPCEMYPPLTGFDKMDRVNYRVMSDLLPDNYADAYAVRSTSGYVNYGSKRYAELCSTFLGVPMDGFSSQLRFEGLPENERFRHLTAARYVLIAPNLVEEDSSVQGRAALFSRFQIVPDHDARLNILKSVSFHPDRVVLLEEPPALVKNNPDDLAADSSAPEFTVSASSSGEGHGGARAFDSTVAPGSFWETSGCPQWVRLDYTNPFEISGYEFQSGYSGQERMPKAWRLQGSDDGTSWVDLDVRVESSPWEAYQRRRFLLSSLPSFRKYRFLFTAGFEPTILRIYEIRLLGGGPRLEKPTRTFERGAEIVRQQDDETEIKTTASENALLLFRESYDPGWRASVNGRPAKILPADHAFMAVEVPKGRGRVIFKFLARGFFVGSIMTLIGVSVLGCIVGWTLRRSKRKNLGDAL